MTIKKLSNKEPRKSHARMILEQDRIIAMRNDRKTWTEIRTALNLTTTQFNSHMASIAVNGLMPNDFKATYFADPVGAFPPSYHNQFAEIFGDDCLLIKGELLTYEDIQKKKDTIPKSFFVLTPIELPQWPDNNNIGKTDEVI